jgi:hypothetical protein
VIEPGDGEVVDTWTGRAGEHSGDLIDVSQLGAPPARPLFSIRESLLHGPAGFAPNIFRTVLTLLGS